MNGFLLWNHLTKGSFYKEEKFTCLYEWMLGSIIWVLKLFSMCIFPHDIDSFCNCLLAILINFNIWSTQSCAKLPHIQLIVVNMKWLSNNKKWQIQDITTSSRHGFLKKKSCSFDYATQLQHVIYMMSKDICSNNLSYYYTTISCQIDKLLSNQCGCWINLFNIKVDIELVYWCQCNSSVDVKFWFKNLVPTQHQQGKAPSKAYATNV